MRNRYELQTNYIFGGGNRAQLGLVGVRGPSESHADSDRKSASTKSGHDGSSDPGGADADRGHAHRDAHSHRDGCTNADAGHAYGNVQSHRDIYGHADIHSHRDGCSNADAGDSHGDCHPDRDSHGDCHGDANPGSPDRDPGTDADSSPAHVYTHTYTNCDRYADTSHTHADPCTDGPACRHFGSGRRLRGASPIGIEVRADRGHLGVPVLRWPAC